MRSPLPAATSEPANSLESLEIEVQSSTKPLNIPNCVLAVRSTSVDCDFTIWIQAGLAAPQSAETGQIFSFSEHSVKCLFPVYNCSAENLVVRL